MPAIFSSREDDSLNVGWNWDHSYAKLPSLFYQHASPTPVRNPQIVIINQPLAVSLGLNFDSPQAAATITGNQIPLNANPIAQAYAGHQFGHFTSLGDGRAILLGEQITPDGRRFDIHLKGCGRTPFSRGGDGRAALGPMLREYIISEAMHALGIPTTRSLGVAMTGEKIARTEMLDGAVLMRVAASHIRVGTFQHAAACKDLTALRALADHTLKRHYPTVMNRESRYLDLFEGIVDRQASLIAKWLHVGFIHGVMNTDNMALSGETIDYGPCAFMDDYDPKTVFSSIDRQGRYAYGNQASIARWNLARLAESMLPLLAEDSQKAVNLANEALENFDTKFQKYWLTGMRAKLGLLTEEQGDITLIQNLLDWMHQKQLDFTNTFRDLSHINIMIQASDFDSEFTSWHGRWRSRIARESRSLAEIELQMRAVNPAVIPRNHQVEEALTAATQLGDLSVMNRLLLTLTHPFDSNIPEKYTSPPEADGPAYQTYCGT